MHKPAAMPPSHRPTARSRPFRPRQLLLALALAGVASHVLLPLPARAQGKPVLPAGLTVVQGQAAVKVDGQRMTVNNSNGAVLNWQSFDIGAAQAVRFNQPTSDSRVFNRVTGANPSSLLGSLSSNGEVWLVNPYGVFFGRDARVDVASLVVSTLNISADGWRERAFGFGAGAAGDAGGAIVNQGELRSTTGGRVLLLSGAGGVRNEGLVAAPDGQVVLAAGHSVDLVDSRLDNLAVRVQAPAGEVVNLGSVSVGGGRVDLAAAMVNQQGIVRADALGGHAGQVLLHGTQGVQLAAGSLTSASGGGRIDVDGGSGRATVAGRVDVASAGSAGGQVQIVGRQVGLLDGAIVDASGALGGGQVLVGGGTMGKDPAVRNAEAVYMGRGASILADATASGDGGRIVLWSDAATRAYGSLSARGGPQGGDGGFVETSGGWLDARPAAVHTQGAKGRAGQWLLDPNNIFITDGGVDTNIGPGPAYDSTDDSAVITTSTILSVLADGTDVTITTASNGANTQAGDIVMFGASLLVAPPQATTLRLNAARNISVQASDIVSQGAPLSVVLTAAGTGVGTVSIVNASIDTAGGNIVLGGAGPVSTQRGNSPFNAAEGYNGNGIGISVTGSTLNAGNGSIDMSGGSSATVAQSGRAQGVSINGDSVVTGRFVNLQGWVDSDGALDRAGVVIEAGSRVTAVDGVFIDGTVRSAVDPGFAQDGVRVAGELRTTGAAGGESSLTITGTVDAALLTQASASSVLLRQNATIDASGVEAMSITGNGAPVRLGESSNFANIFGSATRTTSITAVGSSIELATVFFGGAPSDFVLEGERVSGYSFAFFGGSTNVTVNAGEFAPAAFTEWTVPGSLAIRADTVLFDVNTRMHVGGVGDAVVVSGRAVDTNAARFINGAGDAVFDLTGGGRWLVYATDPTDPANFNAGGLAYDATVYGATPLSGFDAGPQTANGRLQLFSVSPLLAFGEGGPISREYDGTREVDITPSGQIVGLLNGDRLFGTFDTKDVGVNKPIEVFPVEAHPTVLDVQGKPVYGYVPPNALPITGEITPRTLILSVAGVDRAYDGTLDATFGEPVLENLVGAESLGVALTGQFRVKDVGDERLIDGVAVLADGANGGLAGNYQVGQGGAFITAANITPRPLVLADVAIAGKVYDGGTVGSAGGGTLAGLVGGETLTLSYTAQFSSANVGVAVPVAVQAELADDTGLASNYSLVGGGAVAGAADITPRTLNLAGVTAQNKVYDGTTAATVGGGALAGLVGTQTLVLGLSGSFASRNVGAGIAVNGTAVIADGGNGGLASNYTLANGGAFATTADITPRGVTLSAAVAQDKVYDGSTAASFIAGGISNLVGAESLVVNIAGAAFASKDAGAAKAVTATATLANGANGGLAANYVLLNPALTGTASITPKLLSVEGVNVAAKTYDGTTAAALAGGVLNGLVGAETLGLTLAGNFASADAGTGKAVVGTATLANGGNGGLAANYGLVGGGTLALNGDILRRPLDLAGAVAADKVYDGTTTAQMSGGVLANLVGPQTLTVSYVADFDSKDVGRARPVTGTAVLLDGANGGLAANYVLNGGGAVASTANITPRPLLLEDVQVTDKVYDGGVAAELAGGTLVGLVPGEALRLQLSGAFVDKNAGLGKAVVGTALLLDGLDRGLDQALTGVRQAQGLPQPAGLASNYQLVSAGFTATADIAPLDIALAGATAAGKVYDGSNTATITNWQLGGVLEGDAVNVAAGTGSFASAGVGVDKVVTATATVLGGADAGNYRLGQASVSTTATVTPATLTYVAQPTLGLVGVPLGPLAGEVTGFVAGETLASATTGNLSFTAEQVEGSPTGRFGIFGSGLAAANYTFVQAPGNATALTVVVGGGQAEPADPVPVLPVEPVRTLAVLPTLEPTPRLQARTMDALQTVRFDQLLGNFTGFSSLDLSNIPRDTLAALLEARSRYKRSVLDEARRRLEADPSLADVPACETVVEVETGTCLVTDELVARMQGEGAGAAATAGPAGMAAPAPAVAQAPAPAAAAAAAPVPAPAVAAARPAPAAVPPAAKPAAPVAVAPAPAAPAAPAAAAPAAASAAAAALAALRPPVKPTLQAPPLPQPRPVVNATLPQIQRKLAVLIGIDNYTDERIPALENANRDAVAVASILEQKLGYDTLIVRDASREAIIGTLNKLALQARPNDSVMIYYAGHGELVEKTNLGYWIPANADAGKPETWISNTDIDRMIGRIRASQVVLISDSCFSGSLVSDQRVLRAGESTRDARVYLGERAAVVMSSGGNEPVADGGRNGHSPFAWSLMRSIEALPDWNNGSNVFETVRDEVARKLPQQPRYGAARLGRHSVGADYLFENRVLGSR